METSRTPEKLRVFSRYAYTGEGKCFEDPEFARYSVGDRFVVEAGAPGIGSTLYEIVEKNDDHFKAAVIRCTVRILHPSECF